MYVCLSKGQHLNEKHLVVAWQTISHAHLPRDKFSCALHEHVFIMNDIVRKLFQHHTNTKLRLHNLDGSALARTRDKTKEAIHCGSC